MRKFEDYWKWQRRDGSVCSKKKARRWFEKGQSSMSTYTDDQVIEAAHAYSTKTLSSLFNGQPMQTIIKTAFLGGARWAASHRESEE